MLAYAEQQRKVKRLAIKADRLDDVQKASVLIEDALRTASFPGLPKNGLILIRRLELGKLTMSNNPSLFSQRIDQRFLALQPQAITIGHEEQPGSEIVWFADDIEPYILLANLLVQDRMPVSWYWPLAVSEWNQAEQVQPDVKQFIQSVSCTTQGLLIVTNILDRFAAENRIDQFIESISSNEAGKVLRNIDVVPKEWSKSVSSKSLIQGSINISRRWQKPLRKWITELGRNDSRCFLLALCAAAAHDFVTAEFTVEKILHQESVAEDFTRHFHEQDNDEQHNHGREIVEDSIIVSDDRVVKEAGIVNLQDYDFEHEKQPSEIKITSTENLLGQYSANAGFTMLINVLEHLQIKASLDQFPILRELNLPNQIFWACATKMRINSVDSVCQWLTDKDNLITSEQHCPFLAPRAWMNLLYSPHRATVVVIRRVKSDRKKYLLFDSSGKVILAIWRGKMPVAVRKFIAVRTIKRLSALSEVNDLQLIIASYMFAIKRYLRRHVHSGLKQVVEKRGHVAVTRTHLDISFPIQAVDIECRKAGLDIDPGWVPWLGRVVLFHYLEDDQ